LRSRTFFHILCFFLLIPALCLAQMDLPEKFSGFTGPSLYYRALGNNEKIQQFVIPLLLTGVITHNLNIRVYQTYSYAQLDDSGLKEKSTLSGLENTKIKAYVSLFQDTLRIYSGLSLPIQKTELNTKNARLDSLLYDDILQFGVIRITEGLDVDSGFSFVRPSGNLLFGLGAGYNIRGIYDILSQNEKIVSYNPGDSFTATTGIQYIAKDTKLSSRFLYLHFGTDKIDKDEVFKSGDEFSVIASANLKFAPLIWNITLADTLKAKSEEIQKGIIIRNTFDNRLDGGFSISIPLLKGIFIPSIQTNIKGILDNGDMRSKAASIGGGFQLIPMEGLIIEVFSSYMIGDMDFGEVNVNGFNLGLNINYSF